MIPYELDPNVHCDQVLSNSYAKHQYIKNKINIIGNEIIYKRKDQKMGGGEGKELKDTI